MHRARTSILLILLLSWSLMGCGDRPTAAGEPQSPGADAARTAGEVAPAPPTPEPPAEVRVVLLHINDTHGRTRRYEHGGASVGGYDRLAGLVARIRAEQEDPTTVLLLHAGDEFSRGDLLTRRTRGAANIELMNRIGFTAWTPGNGDFYDGLENLQQRIEDAQFAVLTSNVHLSEGERPLGRSGVLYRAGAVRVGLLGLSTVYARHQEGLTVWGAVAAARETAGHLREGGADVVVAVTHLGLPLDRALATGVGEIDVIVGGHCHSVLPEGVMHGVPGMRRTLIVQAGEYARHLGRVDLTLRRDESGGYRLVEASASLIPIDDTAPSDPRVGELLEELWRQHATPAGG